MKNIHSFLGAGLLAFGLCSSSYAQNCSYDPNNPLVISSNTVWNGTQQFNTDIEINSGATLTVYGTVEMLTDGKIIVKPGGKLSINGGHITRNAACGPSWKGIEVKGNRNLSQTPANQGILEIINSGKISHACRGVLNTTHTPAGYDWQHTGGMITAQNAIFENNTRDIILLTYHDGSGSSEPDYKATFTNCDFLRDNNYNSPSALLSHMALLDVAGPSFAGCRFIRTRTGDTTEDRTAIGATNAVFYVTGSPQRNGRFENYDRAIFASGGGRPDKEIEVSNIDFYNDASGVHFMACANVKVQYNAFYMRKGQQSPGGDTYGVYLDNTQEFSVARNYFTNISSGIITRQTPVVVMDCKGYSNRIYKNHIDQVAGSIQCYEHNRNASGTDGLVIQCNDFNKFSNIGADGWVIGGWSSTHSVTAELGIAKHQGPFVPAAPVYSKMANNLHTVGDSVHWWTQHTCQESFYYCSEKEPRCIPVSSNRPGFSRPLVLLKQTIDFDYSTLCPDPPLAISPDDQNTTRGGLMGEDQDWGDTWELLVQLIDNGSTPGLEAQILAAGNPDYQQLYLDLMDMSPYVSRTNLLNLMGIDDFPELATRNILIANPHGARDPEVMEAVYHHQPPFAASTIADIEAGSQTFTSYDVQTAKISGHNYQRHELLDLLMASYGDEEDALDRLAELLEGRDELWLHYMLVDMELQAGRLAEAETHLEAIAATAFMEGSEADLHAGMLTYYGVVTGCLHDERLLTQLNAEEINVLQDMATYEQAGYGLLRNKAISLLWLNEVEAEYRLPDYPAEPQGKRTFSQPNRPAHPLARVQVYPNPATDHLIIQWDWLQLGLSEALLIELYTMDGHLLQSQRVEDFARNTSVVRLHDHLAGSYILRLRSGEDVVYSETLLLQ